MSLLKDKAQLLEELEAWFQSEHPGARFDPEEDVDDLSVMVKALSAVTMNTDEIVILYEEIGVDANMKWPHGFTLAQVALMHDRDEVAQRLYDSLGAVETKKSSKRPKSKK